MVTWMNSLSHGSRSLGDEYKHAEKYPDRYTYYFASVVSDASHLVFIITFHHINRRHALSPDGWGMMRTERVFYVGTKEAGSLRKHEVAEYNRSNYRDVYEFTNNGRNCR